MIITRSIQPLKYKLMRNSDDPDSDSDIPFWRSDREARQLVEAKLILHWEGGKEARCPMAIHSRCGKTILHEENTVLAGVFLLGIADLLFFSGWSCPCLGNQICHIIAWGFSISYFTMVYDVTIIIVAIIILIILVSAPHPPQCTSGYQYQYKQVGLSPSSPVSPSTSLSTSSPCSAS